MTANGITQIAFFCLVIGLLTKPMGLHMARVFSGERTFLHPVLQPIERWTYQLCGVKPDVEQRWTQYGASLLAFSLMSFLFVYLIQRLQGVLPFNPQGFSTGQAPGNATALTPDLAFNTAASFITNTNWQSYAGEATMSYLTQMTALAVQNFVSAAAGVAVATAVIRGFARQQAASLGNFWVDLIRSTVYVFLPLSLVFAVVLCSQGVVQNMQPYTAATTLEGATQTIAQGPIASQEAIKMLGTNGGGFVNANSAHPFENPTPLTNLLQMLEVVWKGVVKQLGPCARGVLDG